jgi:hypothetical protein
MLKIPHCLESRQFRVVHSVVRMDFRTKFATVNGSSDPNAVAVICRHGQNGDTRVKSQVCLT